MRIEAVSDRTFEKVLALIAAYQEFYRVSVPLERSRQFFGRFIRSNDLAIQFIALEEDGQALGFCTLYFIPSSLEARTVCVLNDLYTSPEARGRGVARALIEHSARHAARRGLHTMDWMTARDNVTAQRLYDRLEATRSEWIGYSLPLGPETSRS